MTIEAKIRLAIALGHARAIVDLAAQENSVTITVENSPIVLTVVGDTVTSNLGEEENDRI